MKNKHLLYWIITGLNAAFFGLTSISHAISTPDAVAMIVGLGYPAYIIPFLGFAKILGSIAILIPSFRRIKEWAYAGLFFDLLGATYSIFISEKFELPMLMMFVFIAMLLYSYFLWHNKLADEIN